jgi:D-3-phosphoglycerate dehydrogenase
MTLRILNVEPSRYDAETRGLLGRAGAVDYVDCPDQGAFLRALGAEPYDAVFVRLGLALDREALAAAPTLRYAVTPTTGLDHIDVSALTDRGGRLIALRGETAFLEGIRSTAEHTFALLLALSRRLPAAHADVIGPGNWRREPFLARELHGLTLGIAGLGRLGRMVAGYGLAFGMRVIATDTDPSAFERAPARVDRVGADELLARSDVLSLHLPLLPETAGWLSRERLARLPDGAWLVNTARGELVDEAALLEALVSGRLAGAACDVLAGDGRWAERAPEGHPLISYAREHDNLILTPHVGGYGRHATFGTRRFVVQRFLEAIR